MRGTRWLLLVAIAAIIFGVGVTYEEQKRFNQRNALAAPAPLPEGVSSTTDKGHWVDTDQATGCTRYELWADGMRQVEDSSHSELTGVELRLFHPSGDQCDSKFDLVRSAAATFFDSENRLYAEGKVDITLAEPAEGDPPPNLVSIETSGVTYDTSSGKADTDRHATFHFKNGEGEADGATYDPDSKLLVMKHNAKIDWQAATPHAKALHIEAPSLQYLEDKSEIDLVPSGRMTRGDLTFEGDSPIIRMWKDDGGHMFIREIDADHARGTDLSNGRHLAYSADRVWVFYNDDHLIERMVVEGNAVMNSTAETSETHVTAHHVDMYFSPNGDDKESLLDHVVCNGQAVVTSKPLPAPGKQPSDSHVLRAEAIDMKMQPGGKEIQTVAAKPSGTLEFLPSQPDGHHRTLTGDDMLITYTAGNRIETFHATHVHTTTDPNAKEREKKVAATTTASQDFAARFNPQTSDLASMEQTGSFTYRQGDRQARANKATFDQKTNVMILDGGAWISDPNGVTTADHIRLDQSTGDSVAEGHMSATRMPDQGQKSDSAMLSGDAPLNAQADKMESSNRAGNRRTRYIGHARLWQGANRITADVVEIDRDKHTLTADGSVVTEAWQQPKDDEKKKGGTAVLTKVFAPHLVYTDQDRLALYTGGVRLERPDLRLKSKALHAWLADSHADSQLERAFADGAVEITGARRDNSYDGTSEHAEYYTSDQKVILKGGAPKLVRTKKGQQTVITEPELTYYVTDGNMVGAGAASDHLPPKKK